MRGREVETMGVGWASEEASDIVEPPLNLVLYMHLRIFAYTSNTLIPSLQYMDWTLASGILKNFNASAIFQNFLFNCCKVEFVQCGKNP